MTIILVTVIIMLTILLVGLIVCAKVRKNGKSEIFVVHNDAYGIVLQDMGTYAEDTYDYPTIDYLTVDPFDTKKNVAYATNIETRENKAYATNVESWGDYATIT